MACVQDCQREAELEKRIAELEAAQRRVLKILDANMYHQWEKIDDARAILREAISK